MSIFLFTDQGNITDVFLTDIDLLYLVNEVYDEVL